MSPIDVVGAVATLISFGVFIPQAVRVWTHRANPLALDGVAESGQWLLGFNAILWAVYGVGTGAYWSAAPSLLTLPLAIFVIALLRRSRADLAATLTDPGPAVAAPVIAVPSLATEAMLCERYVAPAGAACTGTPGHRGLCSPLLGDAVPA